VCDEHRGGSSVAQDVAHLTADTDPEFRIKVGERLVHEQDARLGRKGPSQGHSLLLPTGKILGHAIPETPETNEFERFIDPPPGVSPSAKTERNVTGNREMRKQRVVLEDHSYPTALGRVVSTGARDQVAVDLDAPAIDRLQAGNHAQCRRFAAPAGTEERHDLTGRDRQAQVLDNRHVSESLLNVEA